MHEKHYSNLLEQLNTDLKELDQGLKRLNTSVEELIQSIQKRNETAGPLSREESELPVQEKKLLHKLIVLQKTIQEGNQAGYSQMFLLNEQQIKLLSAQEDLIEHQRRQSKSNVFWYSGLGVGILLTLALCLALLAKEPDHTAGAGQVEEAFNTTSITTSARPRPTDNANTGSQKEEAGIPTKAEDSENGREDAFSEGPLREKASVPVQVDEAKAPAKNKQPKKPAIRTSKPDSLAAKGLAEEIMVAPQLLSPEMAKAQIAPRDEYSIIYLKKKNFDRLALKYIHPEKGVHFLPFGFKTPGKIFSTAKIKNAISDSEAYHWGGVEGIPLEIDFQTYYDNYIFDEDFSNNAEQHYNELHFPGKSGLSAAQIAQRFPDCIFVEFCKSDKSLVLVFEKLQNDSDWGLSAVIHNH